MIILKDVIDFLMFQRVKPIKPPVKQTFSPSEVIRFLHKAFCPECNKRVLPADVGEQLLMRKTCTRM